jgi:hypothetical protein
MRWLLAALLLSLAVPSASAEPVRVDIELHVINFGNYDVSRGTYTMDFYLHFRLPPGLDISRFEFMNGRATSKEILSDNTTAGQRDVWYRIQANLFTDPQFRHFPYDRQEIRLILEDSIHPTSSLRYNWVTRGTGLDADLRVAGWTIDRTEAVVSEKTYPFMDGEESYSRLTYSIHVSKPTFSATMRTFLPPVAFLLVASFSFFLDPATPVPRLTLGTGMLISAVAFHLSQVVNVPFLGMLTPFDKFMISAYAFIASSIFVTVALSFGEKIRLPPAVLKLTNQWGIAGSILLPLGVFLLLQLV